MSCKRQFRFLLQTQSSIETLLGVKIDGIIKVQRIGTSNPLHFSLRTAIVHTEGHSSFV